MVSYKAFKTWIVGKKIELKNKFPIPDNIIPSSLFYSWWRVFWGFFRLFSSFVLPASFRYRTKGNEGFRCCSSDESLKGGPWSSLQCPSPGASASVAVQRLQGSGGHRRANTGRLASKQEKWKASSNIITDGLSVPFELFTDWVNDYRQCVSWPGARICYPPIR